MHGTSLLTLGVTVSGPLDGLKVVEVSVAMAGPFCAMTLADLGADVVKIERVGRGDDSRDWPPHFAGGLGHYYAATNRNKRSLALDLKSPRGADIVRSLARDADVLLENYRVGALERAGLGYPALAEVNPRLVYCSISGFGRSGPRRTEPANDLFMQAFSGGMSITGEPGAGPARMGISIADIGAALFATVGVLGALHVRHTTGRGQHVDTSLLGGQLAMLSYHLTSYFASGVVPAAQGSGAGIGVPYQAFPTADDWLVIAVFNDAMWVALCDALAKPDWLADPRFTDVKNRAAHRDLLVGLLSDVLRTRTAEHWVATLKAHGVPCTPVNPIDKVLADPQVLAEGMLEEMTVPDAGTIKTPAPPIGFSETPGGIVRPPPRLGEHSRSILLDLGYTDDAVDRLVVDGVIGLDPRERAA